MEIIQQVDKAQLEETCVLMNGDELDGSREGKNKPYKVTSPLHLLNQSFTFLLSLPVNYFSQHSCLEEDSGCF